MAEPEYFIRVYDDALTDGFCRDVIRRFEEDGRKLRGGVTSNEGNIAMAGKQTTELLIAELAEWKDVCRTLSRSFDTWLERYREEVKFLAGMDFTDLRREGFRIKRYLPGEAFHWHIDCSSRNSFARVLAVQWYFNTVLSGGHTEFEDQQVRIAPVARRVAFFPVSWMYRHRGAPPVSGPKYICTNFLRPRFD